MIALLSISSACNVFQGAIPRNLFVGHRFFSGGWELSEGAVSSENQITLVPSGSPTRTGYAWRLRRAPRAEWTASVTFAVNNRTATTQGGIYLTEDFAQAGTHFGGPAIFHGSAALFEISDSRIRFEFRDNNGQIDFTGLSIIPHLTIDLKSDIFGIQIELSSFRMVRIYSIVDDQNMMIFSGKIREDLGKTWLSIVASCPQPSTELTVIRANLSFADEPLPMMQLQPRTISVSEFDPASGLEHREFQRLSHVLVNSRENHELYSDTDLVFEAILELDRVLNATATSGPTQKAIAKISSNITDSWKRRSLKMVDETHTVRRTLFQSIAVIRFRLKFFEN
jgi:hypothetical protein